MKERYSPTVTDRFIAFIMGYQPPANRMGSRLLRSIARDTLLSPSCWIGIHRWDRTEEIPVCELCDKSGRRT